MLPTSKLKLITPRWIWDELQSPNNAQSGNFLYILLYAGGYSLSSWFSLVFILSSSRFWASFSFLSEYLLYQKIIATIGSENERIQGAIFPDFEYPAPKIEIFIKLNPTWPVVQLMLNFINPNSTPIIHNHFLLSCFVLITKTKLISMKIGIKIVKNKNR